MDEHDFLRERLDWLQEQIRHQQNTNRPVNLEHCFGVSDHAVTERRTAMEASAAYKRCLKLATEKELLKDDTV